MISGIVHMVRIGARWWDCPPEFGPYTTVYSRFNRWSRQGLWLQLFETLTGNRGNYSSAAIDSTSVKVHRPAGAKGRPSSGASAARGVAGRPRFTVWSMSGAVRA